MNIADFLSRLPLPDTEQEDQFQTESQVFVHYLLDANKLHLKFDEVKRVTAEDAILKQVVSFTLNGWPKKVSSELTPYWSRKDSLSVENNCVFWGHRLIIPNVLRGAVLGEIHKTHMGICKMKGIARSYF